MKKSQLSLKWLEVFLLTARGGTVQQAAEEAGLSISTVSHHLRSLEDRLGQPLFDHARRPLRLTSGGAVFYYYAEEALRLLRKAETELQWGGLSELRALSLALIEDFDTGIGPELARKLAEAMPRCRFRHLTRPSHEILGLLRQGEVDIGIAAQPLFDPGDLDEYPLLREPFVLAVPAEDDTPPEDLLAGRGPRPFLRYSANQIMAVQIERQLRRLGISLETRFEFDSNQTLMNMVAEGDGWAITTPLNYLRASRFRRRIALVPFPGKSFARYVAVYAAEGADPQALIAVTGAMRQLIADRAIAPMVERMPWLDGAFRLLSEAPPAEG